MISKADTDCNPDSGPGTEDALHLAVSRPRLLPPDANENENVS